MEPSLKPAAPVHGFVRDVAGKPLEDFRVQLMINIPSEDAMRSINLFTQTDATGRHEVSGVARGADWRVFVTNGGRSENGPSFEIRNDRKIEVEDVILKKVKQNSERAGLDAFMKMRPDFERE